MQAGNNAGVPNAVGAGLHVPAGPNNQNPKVMTPDNLPSLLQLNAV